MFPWQGVAAIVAAVLFLAGAVLFVGIRAAKNTQAIRVSCIVTANVVTAAGAPPPRRTGGPTGQPPILSPQQELTALRVLTIRRSMTPADRSREHRLLDRIAEAGGAIAPDCDKISEHPEDVKPYVPNRTP